MFTAMQETLEAVKEEYYKKFDEKAKVANRKVFSFAPVASAVETDVIEEVIEVSNVEGIETVASIEK